MFSKQRRIQLLSFAVIVGGLIAPPKAQAATVAGSCEFCLDLCPGNLVSYCHEKGCSAEGSTCTVHECQRVNGNWGSYDIACGPDAG